MSGILSNNLNANNKKIENVPDPLNPQDAVNLRTLTTTINNTVPTNVVTKTNNASATSVLQVSENTNKTIKDFISAGGIIKVSSTGVVTLGVAGVDFLTDSSTNTLTNKTFDANGVGNSITNIETTDFATNVIQTSISSSSTNNEIPTALAVWNALSSVSNLLNSERHLEYIQSTPSSSWVFIHNFGFPPVINVTDLFGNELIGYVRTDNPTNTITTITFDSPLTGRIIGS